MFGTLQPSKVIDVTGKFIPIDLSVKNPAIQPFQFSTDFELYINNYINHHRAAAAFGGYDEKRSLYKRSAIFSNSDSSDRNIHIGMDIWAKAGTAVYAVLDGIIHSFNNNHGVGNYGPTIILEHQLENQIFYTLYGHLSGISISNIAEGEVVLKGQKIGALGDSSENGDYAPHLHFQIVKNIEKYTGDYPGVCSEDDRAYYLENCPDPNLLLKLT